MDEDTKRNQRGDISRTNSLQPRQKDSDSFFQNGFQHFPFSTKKMVSVGFLVGLVYFIGNVISTYKLAGTEVDARIDNYKPLNQRLDKIEWRLDALKEKTDKQDAQFQDIADWFKNKGKKK